MTGYAPDVICNKVVVEEGMDFINKPFNKNELLKKIRGVLHNSHIKIAKDKTCLLSELELYVHRAMFYTFWMLLAMAVSLVAPSSANSAPQSIRVVMDDNYPPFTFKNSNGKQQGILIDQWRLWEQKTGIKVEIRAMDWGKAVSLMKAGEFDVIDTIFKTAERSNWLDFTQPYAKIEVPIFFDKNISGITNVNSLKGFVVAVKSGDATIDVLKSNGIDSLMFFNSYEDVIRAAKEHKVNVFVADKPPALYFLYKFGIIDRYKVSPSLYVGEFHRAVKKGNSELLKQVEAGFNLIPANELRNIETKWYGSNAYDSRLLLYFLIVAPSLALLSFILFAWNRILRKMVATRTAELKTSIENLRVNSDFITTLMDAIPVPIFYKDKEGRYLGFNKAFEEFYGQTKEEMIGKSVFDIAPRELAEVFHAKDLEVLQHSGSQIYEYQTKNAQGVVHDVVFHEASFIDRDGQVCGLIGAILDITERKQINRSLAENEARLRTLVNTIPDLVWLKDVEGVYLFCNPMFERFFGAKNAEIVGKTDYDFVDRELADFFRRHDQIAVEAGKPSSNEEWITCADDGREALLNTIKSPMFDDEGKLIGVLGIARDITDIKRAENERLNLERQLLQSQKMESVGILAGGVAHDFNNLLTAISGYGQMLQETILKDDELSQESIRNVLNAADRAAELTRGLLAFSRKQLISPQPMNIHTRISDTGKLIQRIIGEDIEFSTNFTSKNLLVKADPGQIEQLLMNLATNARDAMPHGGHLFITTRHMVVEEGSETLYDLQSSGEYAIISVADTGTGMDKKTLESIFEPFFTTKEVGKGTGLGLSIVHGIIKQHNGSVLVSSEPGKGTTFDIYLPLVKGCAVKDESKISTSLVKGTETLLVVEDDDAVRMFMKKILARAGYKVIIADNGEDAVARFKEHDDISLVLSDLVMPKKSGREMQDEIRNIKPGTKVVFISGYAADVLEKRGMFEEGTEIMIKPFKKEDLLAKIREVLDKH